MEKYKKYKLIFLIKKINIIVYSYSFEYDLLHNNDILTNLNNH